MRIRFLVNPSSGGGRAHKLLDLVRERAASLGAEVEVSTDGADLTARAARAAEDGVERVVALGGDGTVHLVLQGLAGSDCELAVLPSGRGDDFACSIGMPRDARAALDLVVSGAARRLDLGRAGAAWFGIYSGVGFDTAVTETANGQARWLPDAATYVLATLRTLARFRAPEVRVEYDGGGYQGRAMFVTACNAPRFGGGMRIAPRARMDDGLLDLVIVREFGRPELLRVFPKVFKGTHVGHPKISIHRTRRATVEVEPAVLLGADGEVLGRVTEPVSMQVQPAALKVVTA